MTTAHPTPHKRGTRQQPGPSTSWILSQLVAATQGPPRVATYLRRMPGANGLAVTQKDTNIMKKRTTLAISVAVVMSMLASCSAAEQHFERRGGSRRRRSHGRR